MTLQMLKVHPEGVTGVSNTADTLAVVVVKGAEQKKEGVSSVMSRSACTKITDRATEEALIKSSQDTELSIQSKLPIKT